MSYRQLSLITNFAMNSLQTIMSKTAVLRQFAARLHWSFFVCLSASIILLTAGFVTPPLGVIDSSVLTAVGELFCYPALASFVYTLGRGKKLSLSHGNTNVEITDTSGTDTNPPEE